MTITENTPINRYILRFLFFSWRKRREAGRSCGLSAICSQCVTVDGPLTPIDRNTPMGNAEHRPSATTYGMASGTLPSP